MWLVNELVLIFSVKTQTFNENSKSDFSHKTNIFSYDENVKTQVVPPRFVESIVYSLQHWKLAHLILRQLRVP